MNIIRASEFGMKPGNDLQLTKVLNMALSRLQCTQNLILQFEPGEYHFYPQHEIKQNIRISNHDEWNEKMTAFLLKNFENFEIDGQGSRFIFHTEILPFGIIECKNVGFKNFSVDYQIPTYSEGQIVSVHSKQMVLKIDSRQYQWKVKDNCLIFSGENFCYPMHLWLEMDAESGGPAFGTDDLFFCTDSRKGGLHPIIERAGDDKVCLTLEGDERFFEGSRAGNKLVFRHHPRSHPAFFASDSCGVFLEKITVHHAEGMGFIAERCMDISLRHFDVLPDEKNPRCFTAAADAAHFVSCGGKIILEHCRFEKQMDDGVNVHGFYTPIEQQIDQRCLLLGWGHPAQKGIRMARPGDEAAIMNGKTLYPVWKGNFKSVLLQEDGMLAEFDRELPERMPEHAVVENLTLSPDIIIRKCIFRKNRARGILLTCRNALVEDCLFETAGAAVYIEGEACYWYESGAIHSVVLNRNRFLNCAYIPAWGRSPVTVCPQIENTRQWFYHAKLTLSQNEFYCFDERVLYARQVGQILAIDNQYYRTNQYPECQGRRFEIADCGVFLGKSE